MRERKKKEQKKILHKVLSLAMELSDHYNSIKLPVNVDRICIIYNFLWEFFYYFFKDAFFIIFSSFISDNNYDNL